MPFSDQMQCLYQLPSSVEASMIVTGCESLLGFHDLLTSFADFEVSNETTHLEKRSALLDIK